MLALACTGVAYILYFKLIENTGPAKALTVTFMVPVFAILYGVLLLGEEPTLRLLLAAAMTLGGVGLVLIQRAAKNR